MFRHLTTFVCLLAMCLAIVGCDKKIEGVPAEKQISELSEEEQESFCDYLDNAFEDLLGGDDVREAMCLGMAAGFATFGAEDDDAAVAACEESYEECMEDEEEEAEEADRECPSGDDLAECEVTMEELHACVQATGQAMAEEAQKVTQYSCEELIKDGKLEEIEGDDEDKTPEECKVVQEKCPMFAI